MIRTGDKSWPAGRWAKKSFRYRDRFRLTLVKNVEVTDDDNRYKFWCETLGELTRSMSLFTKEPDACEWTKNEPAQNWRLRRRKRQTPVDACEARAAQGALDEGPLMTIRPK